MRTSAPSTATNVMAARASNVTVMKRCSVATHRPGPAAGFTRNGTNTLANGRR